MKVSASFVEMVKGRYREFRREPSAFFFVIFMPVIWLSIMGIAFSGKKQETNGVGILTDQAAEVVMANPMYQSLQRNPNLKFFVGDQADQELFLKRGKIAVVLKWQDDHLHFQYDSQNPQALRTRQMVNDIIQEHFGRTDPVATIDDNKTADGFRYVDFLVPGLLALSILTTSLFGTGMTIVSNRRENLLKLYMTTPMKPFEYILSHIAGRFIIFAFEIASLMLAAYIFFNFRMEGPWLSFLGFAAVGTAMFTAMGILIGSRTRHTIVFSSMVNLTTIALMILGGVWFSRESFPQWLFTLSSYLPLTPLVEGLRAIAIEGADISQTIPQLVLMIVYGLVCAFLAKVSFKWF